jgi:osmotically-inducible protein OsmY
MTTPKPLYALALVLILTGALPGCATYGKCTSGDCSDDAKITANVHTQLSQHAELEAPNLIDVQTLDHVVYLSGQVSSGEQRAIAESVSHDAPGVTRVVNTIAIIR